MRALSQSKTSFVICRRCKIEFAPFNSAQRCKTCLSKRRANRILKRKEARKREADSHMADQAMRAMDGMMRTNGLGSARKIRMHH